MNRNRTAYYMAVGWALIFLALATALWTDTLFTVLFTSLKISAWWIIVVLSAFCYFCGWLFWQQAKGLKK